MKLLWILLVFFLQTRLIFSFSLPYEKMEIVKTLTKKYHSLKITQYVPLVKKDTKVFLPYYWKVYYQDNKIVGEELYKEGILSYFYIYYYTKNKIYQKGFFWYGISPKPFIFKAHETRIKQGFMYKTIPDSYRVFNRTSLKNIYEYYFQHKEI